MQQNKRTKKKDDMTLMELLQWLKKRHKLRRRYESDVCRAAQKQQTAAIAFFALCMLLLLTVSMTYTRLHTVPSDKNASHEGITVSLYGDTPVGNPALVIDAVTSTVHVRIGGGEIFDLETPAKTVGELLTDFGYTCSPDDIVNVSLDAVVENDMTILVTTVTFEEETELVSVPYGTIYEDVHTIPKGSTSRVSYGTEGVASQMQRKRYENGVFVSAEVLSEEIVKAPVDEVLRRGVGGVVSGVDGSFNYSYYIDVTATAYGGYTETRYTYSGTVAKEGVIAVDPDVIPLGSKVYVKGNYGDYGVCSADDIGSGIKNYHIDIFMDATYAEMREFGIREMRVYFLE